METITWTIPITSESIPFIKKSLIEAQKLGFPVADYLHEIEIAEARQEIAIKEQELADLKAFLEE